MNNKLKKYFFCFFHRVGKETWNILPWRAKCGLILLDVILYAFGIYAITLAIKKFVLCHAVICEVYGKSFF